MTYDKDYYADDDVKETSETADMTEETCEQESDETYDFEIELEEEIEDAEEESEFEKELENYLPTHENTKKLPKKMPDWCKSAIASVSVCLVFLAVYSIWVVPSLRPKTVISYSGIRNENPEEVQIQKNPIARVADSVVTITGITSHHSFFGVSSSKSTNSGIVLSEDGYILTAYSLLGQEGITVTVDGQDYEASVEGIDKARDIAIIKIQKTGLVPAVLGDSSKMNMGDPVVCLGNLLGEKMGTSATRGIISGVNQDITIDGRTFNLLQTDAKTADGNAGGPLLNTAGEVVGMITNAVSTQVADISFAIPSNDIKLVADSLISTGTAPGGLIIGITGEDTEHGVSVESVAEDSPASRAGICEGDLILKVDDIAVKSISDINKIKNAHTFGDKLKITLYRDGELMDIEITL